MRLKYPKLSLLVLIIVISYAIFSNPFVKQYFSNLGDKGYTGAFLAGLFYSYGFTGPISAGIFLVLDSSLNIFRAGILGGIGAMIADIFIFIFVRKIFMEEFRMLKEENAVKKISDVINKLTEKKPLRFLRVLIIYALAAFFIGSPLPDEAGIILLAGFTDIKPIPLILVSFVFNTLGILALLSI